MQVTIFLAIDDNGSEWIFEYAPVLRINALGNSTWYPKDENGNPTYESTGWMELPKGTIKLMTGKDIPTDKYVEYRNITDWILRL